MKQIIIACLLATSAASAFAEWTKFEETADGTSFYIDYKTIRKDGNLRMVWGVTDLKQRHKNGEMSRRVRYQFDCREEKVNLLALSTHTEGMTAGNLLTSYTYSTPEWSHIPPGSALESNLKIVCDKPALVEWIKVKETNTETYYMDFTNIRIDGNLRTFKVLQNLKQKGKYGVMSFLETEEVDCKAARNRTLSSSWHTESMARGRELVGGGTAGSWHDLPNDPDAERILKIVCAK